MRRVSSMSFAAGMYVFPGGAVDPRDAGRDVPWRGEPPAAWAASLAADPPLVRALACAAARETFEETGVLLAERAGGGGLLAVTTGADWEADRRELVSGQVAFADLLERRGLVLRTDLLVPWAHWITPECEPKRFSTRFFLAALPAGQATRDVGGEADLSLWITPAEALAALRRDEIAMLPPTAAVIRDLAPYPDVASALAAAADRPIRVVQPKVAVDARGARLVLPEDEGYAEPDR